MQESVEMIIEGCKQGDKQSQYQLYKLLSGRLLLVGLRYLKSRQEAEDCLQDVFIKIFNNMKNYKAEAKIETWATRIMINESLTKLKEGRNYRQQSDIEDALEIEQEKQCDAQEYSELLTLLNVLPETPRLVFNLHVVEGYSHKEIGEIMDLNESTSRSHLKRAKEMLQVLHVKNNKIHYANEIS